MSEFPRKTSQSDLPRVSQNAPRLQEFEPSCSLVVLELEVEATARLERVKVEGPGVSTAATTLLVFRVQWILARVEFLPHFWRDKKRFRFRKFKTTVFEFVFALLSYIYNL